MITKLDKTVVNVNNVQKISSPNYGGIFVGNYSAINIEWDIERLVNITNGDGYNVYLSYQPLSMLKMNNSIIQSNSFQFKLPYFPQNMIEYFWVSKVINNVETFINAEPWTSSNQIESDFRKSIISPIEPSDAFPETDNIQETMKDYLSRIQADMNFMLQNSGSKILAYLRRWGTDEPWGVPCTCGNPTDVDNQFQGRTNCSLCFGTGVLGGYYYPIEMFFSFNTKPAKNFQGNIYGTKVLQTFDAWSITANSPILRSGDLIVTELEGERYEINQVEITKPIRGVSVTQHFTLNLLAQNDIKRIVSINNISDALSKISDPRYNPLNRQNI
jgi:hypothetical protein